MRRSAAVVSTPVLCASAARGVHPQEHLLDCVNPLENLVLPRGIAHFDRQIQECDNRLIRQSGNHLHELFRDTNQTLGSWIRDQRLEACREALRDVSNRQTVAEIAYRWGFGDQAQFSRAFKAHFGLPPKEFREQARQRQPAPG